MRAILLTLLLLTVTRLPAGQDDAGRYTFHTLPDELQFSCWGSFDEHEDELARKLAGGTPAERVAAARELWEGHSRRHARDVLRLVSGDAVKADGFADLKADVEDSFKGEAVLLHLRRGDYSWGTWLAVLRPQADLVPVLLDALEKRPDHRPETVLALGHSRDRRALAPLLALLKDGGYRESGDAAQALGYIGFPEVEPKLVEALDGKGWPQVKACGALARVGTAAALPALERLANTRGYTGALDVRGAAMRAVVAIERRGRPRVPAGPVRRPAAVLGGHAGYVWSVAFSPDGTTLASASDDRTVRLWEPSAGRQTASFPGHARQMMHVAFGPGGRALFTAGWGDDGSVAVLGAASGREASRLPVAEGAVYSFALSADGKLLAASGARGAEYDVHLWDVAGGKVAGVLAGAGRASTFSPDGKTLATTGGGEQDEDIRLWDVATRAVAVTLRGHTEGASAGAFSPDGRTFVSGGDWTVRLWDARTGKARWVVRGDGRISAVAFSPDGRAVAAGEGDAVRVLDAATGRTTAVLKGHGPVAFSPDGKWLATGSEDGNSILLWEVKGLNPPK